MLQFVYVLVELSDVLVNSANFNHLSVDALFVCHKLVV